MTSLGHRLLEASAGTGKTFQLTGRYLALLAGGVEPGSILGTTFTRKAAGEILERVLRRLAEAAAGGRALAELNGSLRAEGRQPVDAPRCAQLLARLLRDVQHFEIRTLDAFFLRQVQGLGLSSGLPVGWGLVDEVDDAELRTDALGRMLEDAGTDEILELLRALQPQEEGRSVHDWLRKELADVFHLFQESEAAAWDAIVLPSPLEDRQLAQGIAALQAADLARTQKNEPYAKWVAARDGLLAALRTNSWEEGSRKGLGAAVLEGDDEFCGKPIEHDLRETIRLLLRHLVVPEVRRCAQRGRAWRRLAERFAGAYEQLKRERRAYGFADLPRILESLGLPQVDAARERSIEHLLLDEFQDTSVAQWRALEPLARRIVVEGGSRGSLFCVGDVKQSIYVWRDGEPRLLEGLPARLGLPDPEPLTDSYRSSQVLLDVVNLVFEDLGGNAALAGDDHAQEVARRWSCPRHVAARARSGSVSLHAIATGDAEDADARRAAVFHAAAEHVERLHREAPGRSIGVLVRQRAYVADLVYRLRERGVRASDEGGNPLTDSAAVLAARSLLRLADHPSDSAAWFHVATSPLAGALAAAFGVGLSLGDAVQDAAGAAALSHAVRRALLEQGYGRTLARLLPAVATHPGWDDWDRGRFGQLVDLGFAWDARGPLRPGELVRYLGEHKVEDPTAAPVLVMTVHASKGLEFDAVVLPDLEQRLDRGGDEALLWGRPDPFGPVTAVFPRVGAGIARLLPELDELFAETRRRQIREELCVLYVAMTRAKERLDLFVEADREARSRSEPRAPTFASVLCAALDLGARPPGVLSERGEPAHWGHEGTAREDAPAEVVPDPWSARENEPIRLLASGRPSRRSASPSALEGAPAVRASDLLWHWRSAAARARGLVLHRWLQEIEWLEDFDLPDERLLALARAVLRDAGLLVADDRLGTWIDEFRERLTQPALAGLLSRGASFGQLDLFATRAAPSSGISREVWRERRFAVHLPDEKGAQLLVRGRFDRVVLAHSAGKPSAAEIVDFKTDRAEPFGPSGLAALVERYRPQMVEYRRVLVALTGLPSAAVTARLAFVDEGVVREA